MMYLFGILGVQSTLLIGLYWKLHVIYQRQAEIAEGIGGENINIMHCLRFLIEDKIECMEADMEDFKAAEDYEECNIIQQNLKTLYDVRSQIINYLSRV